MAILTSAQLVNFFKQARDEKWGYVLGAQGQLYTLELANKWAASNFAGKTATYFLEDCKQWIGHRVGDCSGTIMAALGLYDARYLTDAYDMNADTLYDNCTEKGLISTIPEIPGLFVHRDGHIGIYIGNGRVIENASYHVGVVETPINEPYHYTVTVRPWTGWGKSSLVDYSLAINSNDLIKIMDISHWDTVDFNSLKLQGYDGVYLKATQGTSFVDNKCNEFYNTAKSIGLKVGFYHFLDLSNTTQNMDLQINHFFDIIKSYTNDYVPVLDVENVSDSNVIKYGLDKIKTKYGDVIFYSYPNIMKQLNASLLGSYKLWIANYNVATPQQVPGFPDWTGWQYQENPDLNKFKNGVYLKNSNLQYKKWFVIYNNVFLLKNPSVSSRKVADLKVGTEVILQRYVEGEDFARIEVNGIVGWISQRHIMDIDIRYMYKVIDVTYLDVMSEPTINSKRRKKLPSGYVVELKSYISGDWAKIRHGNVIGYVIFKNLERVEES